jgi:uncharacterized damage-inducible protein DinB
MPNSYTAIVNQAIDLLDGMSVQEYQKKLPPHFPSSIGAHMRHIVDHFTALKNGVSEGHVNYNVRSRESQIEQYPKAATEVLENISAWLSTVSEEQLDMTLSVTTEIDISQTQSATCQSTFQRELVFASSHAIHHYALIRIMCGMLNKNIPEFFGYAPATITHINRSA